MFLTKKTLFFVLTVAVITAGFLLATRYSSSSSLKHSLGSSTSHSGRRKGHNFKSLLKSLTSSPKNIQSKFETKGTFHSTDFEENIISKGLSLHSKFPGAFGKLSIIDELTDIFKDKMSQVTTESTKLAPVCHNRDVIANSCDNNKCLQTTFPSELRERITQIVKPKKLQVSSEFEAVLDSMANKVRSGSEFMILSATSSNHFLETKALIRNLHDNIYPHFKNFTFVLYNLGLTPEERSQMVSFCNCQFVDFPFHKFPNFVSKRLCYSWKPLIVRAHINQANIVMWVDASIRFDSDPSYFSKLLQRTKRRTMQIAFSRAISPFRTFRSMYHYFGDEPCMYLNMGQVQSGIDLFTNELFVKRVVLDPWAACALAQSCMCLVEEPNKSCADSKKMTEAWQNNQGPIVYGLCHRYDQSSLSIILHKLFQDLFRWVTFDVSRFIEIKRKDTYPY